MLRIPDAAQHEVVRHWSGIVAGSALVCSEIITIPGLRRITPLRFVLRRARET
jgi:hypothetical protein